MNENAPETGCESADVTRQATMYVPSFRSRGSGITAVVRSPPACVARGVSSSRPVASSSRSAPDARSTGSVKRIRTSAGASSSAAPSAGKVRTTVAWAPAGGAERARINRAASSPRAIIRAA